MTLKKILLNLALMLVPIMSFIIYKNETFNHRNFVTFDKKKIVELYRHKIEIDANSSSAGVQDLKIVLENRNKKFIAALTQELNKYQKNHNAVIINIECVMMPTSEQAKKIDITELISGKLRNKGIIS